MNPTTFATERTFRFAQFELSEREGELRKKGVRVKLQEQPFRVLVELLANAGKVVTREELQQKLWAADTFVDFDIGLNTAVRKIRQALADDADHPQFIETVAKRGYRFLAPVSQSPSLVSVPVAAPAVAPREPPAHHHIRWYVALTMAAALAAGALWRITRPNPHPAIEKRLTANPVEAPIRAAVISPDGKYVAYADPTGTYLRLVDGGETHPLQLPKNFIALPSSWFPDSSHLLVTSHRRGEQKTSVWKVSILGSPPQILVDDAEGASVSPDGNEIAFFRRTFVSVLQREGGAVRTAGQLWVMGATGDNPHIFAGPTDLSGAASLGKQITAVSWAPDSKHIAYIERHTNFATAVTGDTYQLQTRVINGGEPQPILSDHRLASDALCWAPDGRLLYALRTDPNNDLGDYGTWASKSIKLPAKAEATHSRSAKAWDGLAA